MQAVHDFTENLIYLLPLLIIVTMAYLTIKPRIKRKQMDKAVEFIKSTFKSSDNKNVLSSETFLRACSEEINDVPKRSRTSTDEEIDLLHEAARIAQVSVKDLALVYTSREALYSKSDKEGVTGVILFGQLIKCNNMYQFKYMTTDHPHSMSTYGVLLKELPKGYTRDVYSQIHVKSRFDSIVVYYNNKSGDLIGSRMLFVD